MFQHPIKITLPIKAWFNDAFPDKNNHYGLIPNRSIINKGITGFGITHSELMAKRHSLLAFPYVPIIDSKIALDVNKIMFAVKKKITPEMIGEYLLREDIEYKKIITTPESFWKVIEGAKMVGKLDWLKKEFFCFLDECHCYAIDKFRKDILTPFKFFDEFDHRAMGSATPYPFSNPKFKAFDHFKIEFTEKFGKISIVVHENPKSVLDHYLRNPDLFPGRVFIFYNSVTAIGEAIKLAGLSDTRVYCREEEKNMINLGEAEKYFRTDIAERDFAKFNFFTCRYNEGFDLIDDPTATMVLVTDVNVSHSLVGIDYRGFQSVGRLRLEKGITPHKIIHITNTLKEPCMIDPEKLTEEATETAKHHINYFNSFKLKDVFNLKSLVEKFADIKGGKAIINHEKIDQQVYEETYIRHYNSVESIVSCWQSCNYNTELIKYNLGKIKQSRRSLEEINKDIVLKIIEFQTNPETYHFTEVSKEIEQLKGKFSILFQGIEILGPERLAELNYNNEQIKSELIQMTNKCLEAKLRIMAAHRFVPGVYTKKEIKDILQKIYDELGIRKANGKREIANAEKFIALGLFTIEKFKPDSTSNRRIEKIRIVKAVHTIKQAA